MFYSQYVLTKKGPLGRIWLSAHMDKRLTKVQIYQTDISKSVDSIIDPTVPMALRLSGHLLLGVVRIYSRKARYLLADCNEALVKIKMAFRPGVVDLDPEQQVAPLNTITLPENIQEAEIYLPESLAETLEPIALSRMEDITMMEEGGRGLLARIGIEGESGEGVTAGGEDWLVFGAAGATEGGLDHSEMATEVERLRARESGISLDVEGGRASMSASALGISGVDTTDMGADLTAPALGDDFGGGFGVEAFPTQYDAEGAASNKGLVSFDQSGAKFDEALPPRESLAGPAAVLSPGVPEIGAGPTAEEPPMDMSELQPLPEEPEADAALAHAQETVAQALESEAGKPIRPRKPKIMRKLKVDASTELTGDQIRKTLANTAAITRPHEFVPVFTGPEADAANRLAALEAMPTGDKESRVYQCPINDIDPALAELMGPAFKRARRSRDAAVTAALYDKPAAVLPEPEVEAEVEVEAPLPIELDQTQPLADFEAPVDLPAPDVLGEDALGIPTDEAFPDLSMSAAVETSGLSALGDAPAADDTLSLGPVQLTPAKRGAPEGETESPTQRRRTEESVTEVDDKPKGQGDGDGAKDSWSGRSVRMLNHLRRRMDALSENEDALSYLNMVEGKRRRVVAGTFFELLVLKSRGFISTRQDEPYGDIHITKDMRFHDAVPTS